MPHLDADLSLKQVEGVGYAYSSLVEDLRLLCLMKAGDVQQRGMEADFA